MKPAAVTFDNIRHGFTHPRRGTTHVLDDISFMVEEGEFVCVMGPSGCGKSTLLTMAAGFLAPDAGQVTWRGVRITRPDPARGFVFQRPQLYPWLDAQTREEMQALLLRIWQRMKRTVVFVTHDVEEALLLADRVVVLSRRPARVVEIVKVDFPRPRRYELVLDPEFVALRGRVRASFVNEVAA